MSNDEYQQLNWWKKSICVESDKDGKCLMSMHVTMLDLTKNKELFCDSVNKYPKHTRDNNLKSIENIEPTKPTHHDPTI